MYGRNSESRQQQANEHGFRNYQSIQQKTQYNVHEAGGWWGGQGIRSGRKHMRETDGIRQVKRDRRPDQRMGSDGWGGGGCKYKESKLKGQKA